LAARIRQLPAARNGRSSYGWCLAWGRRRAWHAPTAHPLCLVR